MDADKANLLGLLKRELEFLNSGAYRKASWRPQFIFEDSPICRKNTDPAREATCAECGLLAFVPRECRKNKAPCRQIALNKHGDSVDYLYHYGTHEELEEAVRLWLVNEIHILESGAGHKPLIRIHPEPTEELLAALA